MELVLAQETEIISLYQKGEGLDPLIEAVREKVDAFEHNLTTAKGRAETKTLAANVSKAKTMLDGLGKKLTEKQKAEIKIVDNSRKKMRDQLDELRDKARAPLTEWEEAEDKRVKLIQQNMEYIEGFMRLDENPTAKVYQGKLEDLVAFQLHERFGERQFEAEDKKSRAIVFLEDRVNLCKKSEAEKEELEALRAEKEARAREDQAEADRVRKAEIEEELIRQENERLEQVKNDAVNDAKAEVEAAKEKAKKAEWAAEQAEANARKKLEAEKEKELAEAKAREENAIHNREIKTEVKNAMIDLGIPEKDAINLIVAICKNEVPHISIRF